MADLPAKLRDAAQRREWNECWETVEIALARLSISQILALAHRQVQRRLSLFERHHPDIHWPREWLDALGSGTSTVLDEAAPEVLQDAPGPGGNNFATAVQALARASKAATSTKCAAYAARAIRGAIMAEEVECAGSEAPELWRRWYENELRINAAAEKGEESDAEPNPFPFYKIMKTPKVAAVELAAWNALADELETFAEIRRADS